jgi:hypothetical protein
MVSVVRQKLRRGTRRAVRRLTRPPATGAAALGDALDTAVLCARSLPILLMRPAGQAVMPAITDAPSGRASQPVRQPASPVTGEIRL